MAESALIREILPFIAGTLPCLLWLWFWLKEDSLHPEPRKTIFITFIAGALSTMIALPLQQFAPGFLGLPVSHENPDIPLITLWASAEELAKYMAAALVALSTRYFDEPIDAMIYMLTAAVGFASLENVFFLIRDLNDGGVYQLILTTQTRFLGATLLHIVASALAGGFLALAFYKNSFVRILYTVTGLAAATALHAAFNFFIMKETRNDALSVLLSLWLSVFLVFLLFEKVKHLKQQTP